MLCKEYGVLPGSDYYLFADERLDAAIHPHIVLCGHYHCIYGYTIERPWYEYQLVTYIRAGTFHLEYGGARYAAHAGDVVLIDCNKPHHFWSGDDMEFVWIHFMGGTGRAICAEINERHGPVLRHGHCSYINERIYETVSAFRNGQQPSTALLSAGLLDVLYHAYPPKAETLPAPRSGHAVALATEYMKLHIAHPITTQELADAVHMSRYHFSRVFRAATGLAPYEYLLRLRFGLAQHLLKTTDQTIREIAFATGYRSETGFANAFTERIGIPPGQYRAFPL